MLFGLGYANRLALEVKRMIEIARALQAGVDPEAVEEDIMASELALERYRNGLKAERISSGRLN